MADAVPPGRTTSGRDRPVDDAAARRGRRTLSVHDSASDRGSPLRGSAPEGDSARARVAARATAGPAGRRVAARDQRVALVRAGRRCRRRRRPTQRIVEAAAGCPRTAAVTGWACADVARRALVRRSDARRATGARSRSRSAAGDIAPAAAASTSAQELVPAARSGAVDGVRVTTRCWTRRLRDAQAPRPTRPPSSPSTWRPTTTSCPLAELAASSTRARWIRQGVQARARAAAARSTENSWSPQEPVMRRHVGGRRLPAAAAANRPVFDLAGRLVGTPDLLDPDTGVVRRVRRRACTWPAPRATPTCAKEAAYRGVGLEAWSRWSRRTCATADPFVRRLRDGVRASATRRAGRRAPVADRAAAAGGRPPRTVDAASGARRRTTAPRLLRYRRASWPRTARAAGVVQGRSGRLNGRARQHEIVPRYRERGPTPRSDRGQGRKRWATPVADRGGQRPAAGKVSTQAVRIELRHAPADGGEALGGADAHDRGGDGVGGRDRGLEDVRRRVEHRGRHRLGREAAGRVEVDDAAAEGAHDAPAAGLGAERDRGRGREDHPERAGRRTAAT